MQKQHIIFYLFWAAMCSVMVFSCGERIKIDPENKATALVNGEKWESNVEVTEKDGLWEFYLFVNDEEGITRERMLFNKINPVVGNIFLNRPSLTFIDTSSTEHRYYYSDGDVGGSPYSVRVEGSPENWLKIKKYDATTESIEAEFQGTYVKCDAEFNVYGGDSLIFKNGTIKAQIKK